MFLFFSGGLVDWENQVVSGRKVHTIRKGECARVKAGTALHFLVDRFKPTRRKFFETTCTGKQSFCIVDGVISVDGVAVSSETVTAISINGGFKSVSEMMDYYGSDFSGTIIHWTNIKY